MAVNAMINQLSTTKFKENKNCKGVDQKDHDRQILFHFFLAQYCSKRYGLVTDNPENTCMKRHDNYPNKMTVVYDSLSKVGQTMQRFTGFQRPTQTSKDIDKKFQKNEIKVEAQ